MAGRPVRIRRAANEGVLIGSGAVVDELAAIVDSLGCTRVALITTPSVAASPLLEVAASALGDRLVATFAESRAHTPRPTVLDAARVAAAADADGLVSLGGSSVVDLTKAVAMVLANGDDLDRLRDAGRGAMGPDALAHVAIPTTLSAAEFTAAAGVTDPSTGVKEVFGAAPLAPRWVMLDAAMTAHTPDRLWRGTGMKLVADCLEGMLSRTATGFTDALLEAGLRTLLGDLGADRDDLAARGRCLEAAHMTLSNLHNVGVGAVAALRHQIGGRCGVPHGEASTIVLPHVMRWNGEAAQPVLDRIGSRLDWGGAASVVDRVAETITALGLPSRLRDVGVEQQDLGPIAHHAASEPAAVRNIRPATTEGLTEVLQAAW